MIARPLAVFAALSMLQFSAAHALPPPNVQAEIEYLLQSIETSGCEFYRNGTWYSGSRARAHLRGKYDYLVARRQIVSAEDFIDKGATKSSLSAEAYRVRCGNGAEMEAARWLREALARYRVSGNTSGRLNSSCMPLECDPTTTDAGPAAPDAAASPCPRC